MTKPKFPDASGWAKIPEGSFQPSILGPRHHYSIIPSDHDGRGWAENGLYKSLRLLPPEELKRRYYPFRWPFGPYNDLHSLRRDLPTLKPDEAQYHEDEVYKYEASILRRNLPISDSDRAHLGEDEEDEARMRPAAAQTLADRLASVAYNCYA